MLYSYYLLEIDNTFYNIWVFDILMNATANERTPDPRSRISCTTPPQRLRFYLKLMPVPNHPTNLLLRAE